MIELRPEFLFQIMEKIQQHQFSHCILFQMMEKKRLALRLSTKFTLDLCHQAISILA